MTANLFFRKDAIMCFSEYKRRSGRRISVWVLIFTLMLAFISSTLLLPISAAKNSSGLSRGASDMGNAIGNAAEDMGSGIGEAASDVGDGIGEAISDVADSNDDGKVNDTDGMIGNADSGADKAPSTDTENGNGDKSNGGWIALAIAIVVIVAVVVLIVVLIPRRKDKE